MQIISWEYYSFLIDIVGNVWAVPNQNYSTIFYGLINPIFIPEDEITINVLGTRPYDGAPGGYKDSMALLGAVDPGYGDIVALFANHCFIPTISSLDLDTTDLFYDIAGDTQLLDHTPFDAAYFPTLNQEHVAITSQNAAWLLSEIRLGASGLAGPPAVQAWAARIEAVTPSPASSPALVRFSVPREGSLRLAAYDPAGREVAILVQGAFDPGEHLLRWDPRDSHGGRLEAGVYFLRLAGEGFAAAGKITLR